MWKWDDFKGQQRIKTVDTDKIKKIEREQQGKGEPHGKGLEYSSTIGKSIPPIKFPNYVFWRIALYLAGTELSILHQKLVGRQGDFADNIIPIMLET